MDANRIYENLGKRIKELRKSVGQTQGQLADQIGISRASLANIEAGRQQVLVHHLLRIASALQLDSPAQLLLSPSTQSPRQGTGSPLPLADEGLTERQRSEVLSLMGDFLGNNHSSTKGEDE